MALIVLPFERIDNAAAAQVEQPVHQGREDATP